MLGAIEKEQIDCIEGVGDCTDRRTGKAIHLLREDGRATDEIRQWSKYIGDKLHSYWRKPPKKVRNCKVALRESIAAWHRLDTTGRAMMIKQKDHM